MKGVLMTKMIQELNLNNLTPEIVLSDMSSLPVIWNILLMNVFRSLDM